ncbi:MAG: Mu transposase C-terminal domain-containing protein [Rhodocyclaceae bacterium]|nr:Mu transposase C-terminal domain-containing protein [Rhodocyclaceae bacterium]
MRAAPELPTYGRGDGPRGRSRRSSSSTRKHRHCRQLAAAHALGRLPRLVPEQGRRLQRHASQPAEDRDDATGKLRHMSPDKPGTRRSPAAGSPSCRRRTSATISSGPTAWRRSYAVVRLFNNLYFSPALEEHHSDQVQVGYDIHDGSRVWVRDLEGRLICVAEFEANKRAYFPQSVIDRAAEKRPRPASAGSETHLQEVRDELAAPLLIEQQAAIAVPIQMPVGRDELPVFRNESTENCNADTENVVSLPSAETRPLFGTDPDKYRWLMAHKVAWTADDGEWLWEYVASDDYEALLPRYAFQGTAWGAEDDERVKSKRNFEAAAR